MKRLVMASLFFVMAFFASQSFAAMDCTHTGGGPLGYGSRNHRVVLTCTFDTTPGTAVDTIPTSAMSVINNGKYVYAFKTKPGSTGPTDDSDLQIADSDGFIIVSASGNGADVIDNATNTNLFYGDGPTAGSTNHYPMGDGLPWTITVTNNAVNSSSFNLIIQVAE